ncbi:tetratricopeptide repeat protein [Rubricoccus marinus]|uniref:Tetratricopeptide repeat-like domain-containing protein n=1 Tax=Rubricoccus marinus TaxID=716817 RepID=A0A259U2J0_9BACT|nr:tetratricopeptide repeat protein [Rubricoccus marinus]OZC04067.1 hypothetical protein BSZ36_14385 [Rubricoccus marinus]
MRFLVFLLLSLASGASAQTSDPMARADEAYRAGRYAEAARHAETAVRQRPGLASAHVALSSARLRSGDASGAEQAARSALQRFPGDALLTALRADALLTLERFEDAIPLLDALRRSPPPGMTPEVARERAAQVRLVAAVRSSDPQQQLAWAREAREIAPEMLNARTLEAGALLALDRAPEAREVAEAALRLAPEDPVLLRLVAQADAASGDAAALSVSAARLAEAAPEDLSAALLAGRAYLASGETERAAETFGDVLERFADRPAAYDGVAAAYEQVGFAPAAVGVLEAWREIAPEDTAVVSRLGDALAASARPVEAEAVLDTLRAMGGNAAWSLRRSARAHALLDRWTDAARLYEAAFGASGDAADARAAVRAAHRVDDLDAVRRVAALWRARAPSPEAAAAYALSLPLPEARVPTRDLASGDDPRVALRLAQWNRDPTQAIRAARLALALVARGRADAQAALAGSGLQTDATPALERPGLDARAASRVAEDALALAVDLDAQRALEVLEELQASDPESAWIGAFQGRALAALGQVDRARDAFARAARLAPEAFVVHAEAGRWYESVGEWDAAALAWERAAALDGPAAYASLIRVHRARGSLGALADRWLARLRTTAHDEPLRQATIEALHKAGRSAEARALAGRG